MKSVNLTESPHIMPTPPKTPWNAQAMSWTMPTMCSGVMRFNGQQIPDSYNQRALNHYNSKRKSEFVAPLPSKQFITEEKMAAHLSGLHISSDYVSHNASTSSTEVLSPSTVDDPSMEADLAFRLPMTPKDLEEKLKNANSIKICDEIKKFNQENTIIPKVLLDRWQKPCTALVLWQPPTTIKEKIVPSSSVQNNMDSESDDEDNNNSSNLDYNNCSMDTDADL